MGILQIDHYDIMQATLLLLNNNFAILLLLKSLEVLSPHLWECQRRQQTKCCPTRMEGV